MLVSTAFRMAEGESVARGMLGRPPGAPTLSSDTLAPCMYMGLRRRLQAVSSCTWKCGRHTPSSWLREFPSMFPSPVSANSAFTASRQPWQSSEVSCQMRA
jgi:hypothetical protein